MATSIVELVGCAGGWLFDRAMAGWDVTVLVPAEQQDIRPLQILGVHAADLEAALIKPQSYPAALGVTTDLYFADGRVRDSVHRALSRRRSEVTLWGEHPPIALGNGVTSVRHELSSAARSFKAHALAASTVPAESVDSVEVFCTAARNPRTRDAAHLRSVTHRSAGTRSWTICKAEIN